MQDLIELGVLGDALHERFAGGVVHFGAAHRDDIDGADARLDGGDALWHVFDVEAGREVSRCAGRNDAAGSRVGVVVPLQDEVDAVLVEQRLVRLAQFGVIAIFRRRKQRRVQGDDRPAAGV